MDRNRFDALSRKMGDATSRRGLLSLLGGGVVGTAVATVRLNETQAKSNHRKNRSKRDKRNNGGNHKNGPKNSGPFERMTDIPISAHDQQGHNFQGVLDITGFVDQGGQLVALGTVSGKVTGKGVGNQTVTQNVTLPASVAGAGASVHSQVTCQILDLTLGPIDLNLLGLVLHVNQIHIVLTANSLGGILGSLLCSLAGPLSGLLLGDLVILLNQILAILQGL